MKAVQQSSAFYLNQKIRRLGIKELKFQFIDLIRVCHKSELVEALKLRYGTDALHLLSLAAVKFFSVATSKISTQGE